MAMTARRLTILTAAVLSTLLTACANPTAPSSSKSPRSAPNQDGAYQGSVG